MGENSIADIAVLGWLLGLAAADLDRRRLPNLWTVPPCIAVVLSGVAGLVGGEASVLAGAALAALAYLPAFGMGQCGGGDVKFAVALGGLTGGVGALAVVGLAAVITVCSAAVRRDRGPQPHGPALAAAAVVVLAASPG